MDRWSWIAALIVACSPAPPLSETISDETLLRVAAEPGLVRWQGDVLLVCETPPGERREPCRVRRLREDGNIVDEDVGPVLAAEPLADGRRVLLRPDRRLVLHASDGAEVELSPSAFDPRVASDGVRVMFREAPDPESDESVLIATDTATLIRTVITEDSRASSAFDVPGDVPGAESYVFVSVRSGIASLFVTERGVERQLTNEGQRVVGPDSVPVPIRQRIWIGRTLVFTAHYRGETTLWQVDVDSGEASRLGPGRFPVAVAGASLKAVAERDGELVVVRYPAEVTP